MKISIITATYNGGGTIRDALNSVGKQTWANIEHIVIDGNSTDDTLKIVAEFPHVSTVLSEPDNGIYDAMNKGIALATGDAIMFLNSDDLYTNPTIIEQYVKAFESQSCDSVYSDLFYVDYFNIDKITRKWRSKHYSITNFLNGWMPPHPTFAVRKHYIEKYGAFNTDFSSAADYELMLRLLYKHKVTSTYLEVTSVLMRQGGKSNASIRNRVIAHMEDRKAWKVNKLKPRFYTTFWKPLSKLTQFHR